MSEFRASPEPETVRLVLARASDGPMLCAELRWWLARGGARRVLCDVPRTTPPTLATIDALARLALTAKCGGADVRLIGSPALRALVGFVGLADVLPAAPSVREPEG